MLRKALEHAVSEVEEKEGRFPAISGFSFKYDPSKPKLNRIEEITLNEKGPLNDDEQYTMAINYYIVGGGDGFDMFKDDGVTEMTQSENSPWLIDVVKQFFSRTSTSYKDVPGKRARREARFQLFNMDADSVSPDGKWLMINPKISGRVQAS